MLRTFMLNVFLAVVYAGLLGSGEPLDFLIGFVIGFVVIVLANRAVAGGGPTYLGRTLELLRFSGYFLRILVQANLQVAWEVITPGLGARPRIIRYPVGDLSDAEVTTLANAITLTPGTLTVDVAEPRPGDPAGHTLYIHCMYAENREAAVAELDALRLRLHREVFDGP